MNSELPLVSIVAICYNQESYVIETLESIKKQSYPNIQLIIIDDHSTDNSVEVIQSWININSVECEFVKHSENLGVTKTCNDGLRRVKGTYYQIIACDDLLLPIKIEEQVNQIKNYNAAAVYSNCHLINENGEIFGNFFKDYLQFIPFELCKLLNVEDLLDRNYCHPVTGLISTSEARKLKGYDENLFAEDWDFGIRLTHSSKVFIVNELTSSYRILSSSLNHRPKNRYRAIESAMFSFLKYRGISTIIDKKIKANIIRFSYELYKLKSPYWRKWAIKSFILYPNRLTFKRLFNILKITFFLIFFSVIQNYLFIHIIHF